MRRLFLGVLLGIMFAGSSCLADGEGTPPKAPRVEHTPATFFAAEKTCKAASDGCQTCKRTEHGFSCSTPGIACVAKVWVCTE